MPTLQLDDVILIETEVPGWGKLRISGVVDMVRARHEGSRFASDVFLAEEGLLPVETARAAHVVATRLSRRSTCLQSQATKLYVRRSRSR